MQFSAEQIAQIIEGSIVGNKDVKVNNIGRIENAQSNEISFLANPKYEEFLYNTNAGIVIVNDSLELKKPVNSTLIKVADAYSSFAKLLTAYEEISKQQLVGIHPLTAIDETAKLGDNIFIGAFVSIGKNCTIGKNCKIYPNVFIGDNVVVGENNILYSGVKIYKNCVVGNDNILQSGAVIGGDGFGFAPQADGSYKKVPQIGNVIIENNVEIGANTTIDRATIGSTIIKSGAKLDNLVQIAHNVEIGNSTVIAAQTGVSGSTKIGKQVMIGGQAGIVGHITIGDGAKINAQSGVSKSIDNGKTVTGSPASDFTSSLRKEAATRKLPELEKRVKELEKIIEELKKK